MIQRLIAIIVGFSLTGCTLLPGIATSEAQFESLPPPVSREEVAALQPGSVVQIQCDTPQSQVSLTGTVLQASPDGVALKNCRRVARSHHETPIASRIPYVNRMFKVSGIGQERLPVHWASVHQMTAMSVVEPPPADYVAPQLEIDTNDKLEFERIGVDFNFDENNRSIPPQRTRVDEVEESPRGPVDRLK